MIENYTRKFNKSKKLDPLQALTKKPTGDSQLSPSKLMKEKKLLESGKSNKISIPITGDNSSRNSPTNTSVSFGSPLAKRANIIDLRTGHDFYSLKQKMDDFDTNIDSENLDFILNVSAGDIDALLRYDNLITVHKTKRRASIYFALTGLESFRRRATKDKALLQKYINKLAPKLESDITKLEELIMFLITGRRIISLLFLYLTFSDSAA